MSLRELAVATGDAGVASAVGNGLLIGELLRELAVALLDLLDQALDH